MKSSQVLLVPVFLAASVHADVLSDLSPYLGSTRPDYNPAEIQPEVVVDEPRYAPFSPADSDLGVQQVLGPYTGRAPVKVAFDTSISFTDNAPGLGQNDDDSAWLWASRLGASWQPRIAHGWFADIGLMQEVYRFDGDNAADFENFTAYLGVVKAIPQLDDLVFYARYEYERVTTGTLTDTNFSAQRVRTGLQKDLLLAPHYQLSGGVDAAFDVNTQPDKFDRDEYSANLSFTYWFADHLSSTLSWTGTYWDFDNESREDFTHNVGIELDWAPCKNGRVYTSVFYTNHNSDDDSSDFQAWQAGVGAGFTYSF